MIATSTDAAKPPVRNKPAAPRRDFSEARARVARDREIIRNNFPGCFAAKDEPTKKPLKVGIHLDVIAAKLQDPATRQLIPEPRLLSAIKDYASGPKYHKAVAAGGPRYALDGSACGEITEHEQAYSRAVLRSYERQSRKKQQSGAEKTPRNTAKGLPNRQPDA